MDIDIQKVCGFLKKKYNVDVVIKDTHSDGVEIAELAYRKILVNKNSRDSLGILFVIAHLFGHMVQFSHYEDYRYLVETVGKPKPLILSEDFKKAFYAYETEAQRIGKGLIATVYSDDFASELDEKIQIYLKTDFDLFWNYLMTDKQASAKEFNEQLLKNFETYKGQYPVPLEAVKAPEALNPSTVGAKVY